MDIPQEKKENYFVTSASSLGYSLFEYSCLFLYISRYYIHKFRNIRSYLNLNAVFRIVFMCTHSSCSRTKNTEKKTPLPPPALLHFHSRTYTRRIFSCARVRVRSQHNSARTQIVRRQPALRLIAWNSDAFFRPIVLVARSLFVTMYHPCTHVIFAKMPNASTTSVCLPSVYHAGTTELKTNQGLEGLAMPLVVWVIHWFDSHPFAWFCDLRFAVLPLFPSCYLQLLRQCIDALKNGATVLLLFVRLAFGLIND